MKNAILRKRKRVSHVEPIIYEKAKTQQQFKEECDINYIIKKAKQGTPPLFLQRGTPQYGDFSNVPNLQQAYEMVENAHSAFMNLPAQLRLELNNDPANINRLTADQIERYKLTKEHHLPNALASGPEAPPKAGQAASTGTEPVAQKPKKPTEKVDGDS